MSGHYTSRHNNQELIQPTGMKVFSLMCRKDGVTFDANDFVSAAK